MSSDENKAKLAKFLSHTARRLQAIERESKTLAELLEVLSAKMSAPEQALGSSPN